MKKFFKGLLLTVLVIVLFLTTTFLLILFPLKHTVGEEGIKEVISSLDLEQMSTESPKFQDAVEEMLEPIYDETRKYGIPDEIILKIVNSNEVKMVFADVTSNVIKAILTGEAQKIITTDNITELVAKAIDDINATGLYEISSTEKNNVLNVVQETTAEYVDYLPDTNLIMNNLSSEDKELINIIRFILSNELIIYDIIVLVLALGGLVIVKYHKAKWLKWSVITILTAAVVNFIISFLLKIVITSLFKLDYAYIYNMFNSTIKYSLIMAGIISGLMIIILIGYKILTSKNTLKTEK